MRITIVGGGNIGTQFAVHCAEKGHFVIVYTSDPAVFHNHLRIVDNCGNTTHEGVIEYATNDPEKAFCNADIVFVTYPPMVIAPVAELIYQYAPETAHIGLIPGNGGGECAFRKCIERGNIIFGLERVPGVARLVSKGESVRSYNYRDELHVSSIPAAYIDKCCQTIEEIFEMPCRAIPNYLNLTLTPSNPILHTTRLYTLFKDYCPGKKYSYIPLFYEEWDNDSSELLIACDNEVQAICRALSEFDLTYVKSLKDHYESQTVEAMTKKISSIPSFRGIKTPTREENGNYIPDLHSRFFVADFSYGLVCIKQIADFAKVSTPNIDHVLDWYRTIALEKAQFRFEDYGITDRDSLDDFYLRK